jgi:hypothetical protein
MCLWDGLGALWKSDGGYSGQRKGSRLVRRYPCMKPEVPLLAACRVQTSPSPLTTLGQDQGEFLECNIVQAHLPADAN